MGGYLIAEIINQKVSSKTHLAPYNFKPLFVQFHPSNKRKLPYFLLRRHNSHCEGVIFFPQPLRQPTGQDTVAPPTTCNCNTRSETHTLAQLGAGPDLAQTQQTQDEQQEESWPEQTQDEQQEESWPEGQQTYIFKCCELRTQCAAVPMSPKFWLKFDQKIWVFL